MLLRRPCSLLAFAALALVASAAPPKVLFFSKSSNFEHSVVKRRGGQPSWAEQVLAREAAKRGIEFVFSKDGSLFTPAYLAQFDAFIFYTSGDLLAAGKDGNPPMTAAGKAALLDAVAAGKGFVGIHAAADTFHTGETVDTNTSQARTWRYRHAGEKADPYIRMLGGELIVHGTQQLARARIADPKFPGLAGRGEALELQEEWYSLTDFSPDLHVLLVLDTGSMRDLNANGSSWPPAGWNTPYQRPPYPVAWTRLHGQGRVFFSAIGHREDTWLDPVFLDFIFGGLNWAVHAAEADVTPNLSQVAPGAYQLPPVSRPIGGLPEDKKAALEKTPFP
jgi:type 1 glutamine amidotransferase